MPDTPNNPPNNSPNNPSELVIARDHYPTTIPVLPLPHRPVFPKTVAPLKIEDAGVVRMLKEVLEQGPPLVGLVLARTEESSAASAPGVAQQPLATGPEALHQVGVLGQIVNARLDVDAGTGHLLVGGIERFVVHRVTQKTPWIQAEVVYLPEADVTLDDELRALAVATVNSIKDLVQLNPLFKQELTILLQQGSIEEPGRLADYAAWLTSARGAALQEVLETLEVRARLEKVMTLLHQEIDLSRLQARIRSQIEERMSKQQREFFLREQLKAIKQELGLEKDDKDADLDTFLGRLEGKAVPEEAQRAIDEEAAKLRLLDTRSPEFNISRNYLDWLTDLPWGVEGEVDVTLARARKALDAGHYGLDDVKDRILEFIAAGLLRGRMTGSILLLVGPPGVGKTSIGKAVAEALDRPFYRFSVGGMRDEAEIKGHRRTYIGALPGKLIQALRKVERADAVLMLDEVDKIGASYRGDPASALLEVLDPEQNRDFLDHYLDVRFDLSNVLFICTANQLDTIPAPLLDRMEVIKLSGYLLEEKLEIARRYLVPRELAALGLGKGEVAIRKAALREMVDGYAREPGLRHLQKLVAKVVRKVAVQVVEARATSASGEGGEGGDGSASAKIVVDKKDVATLLGPRLFRDEKAARKGEPGLVRGLAWTAMGGDTLTIEATAVPGKPGFQQTGQLGDVMIESARIAYTVARQRCAGAKGAGEGSEQGFFDRHHIHLHVPAGATKKDGPSAGVTMATALISLARGVAVDPSVAMTGELTLRGRVMPVGGIREKVLAARRARVKTVLIPKDNEGDWQRLPEHLKAGLEVIPVAHLDEVLGRALQG